MANTEHFRGIVSEFVKLNDSVTQTTKALTGSRKRLKELQTQIIDHMMQHKLEACSLRDGMLILKTNKTPTPLNKDLIAQALEEDLGPEKAEALAEKVGQARENAGVERPTLKRTKQRAAAPAPAASPAP